MPRGYRKERTNVHNLHSHFIWSPKYRKKVLTDGAADRLESLIKEKADELDLEIIELTIQPDHVHLFITGHPMLAPDNIVQQLMGYSSRVLHYEFDFGLPTLWTRIYDVFSAGDESSQTIDAQTGQ